MRETIELVCITYIYFIVKKYYKAKIEKRNKFKQLVIASKSEVFGKKYHEIL